MRRVHRRRAIETALVTALCALSPATGVLAQSTRPLLPGPDVPIAKAVHRSWGVEDGLPVRGVLALETSPDGLLWIGTEEGAVRFDGHGFRSLAAMIGSELPSLEVYGIAATSDGDLWLATRGHGLAHLHQGRVEFLTAENGMPSDLAYRVLAASDGSIWVGTRGQGVARVRGDSIRRFGASAGLPHGSVTGLAEGPRGAVWVATRGGLAKIEKGRVEVVEAAGLPSTPEVESITVDDGVVWVGMSGTEAGLYRLSGAGDEATLVVPGVVATAFLVDSRGGLWFTTTERGVGRLDERGVPAFFTTSDGLTDDFATSIVEDGDGGVWVGTASGGLNLLLRSRIGSLTAEDGLSSPVVLPIAAGRGGVMWVGTAGGGLNRVSPGGFVDRPFEGRLPSEIVLSLLPLDDGTVWVGTRAGLARIGAGGSIRTFGAGDGLPVAAVPSLVEDPRGGVWVGTAAGLARVDGDEVTPLTDVPGLPVGTVYAMRAADAGVLVAVEGYGVTRFEEGGEATVVAREVLAGTEVLTIHERDDGTLWLGTSNSGLYRVRDGAAARIGRSEGLPGDEVFAIVDDGRGRFWFCHNHGIYAIEVDDLEAVAEGDREQVSPRRFGRRDGMPSPECNGGFQPSWARGPEGTIWFPTMGGVAIVDPETTVGRSVRPDAVLERIVVEGEPRAPGGVGGRELAAGTDRVRFDYTNGSPSLLGEVVYRFRLDGVDDDWIDAGTNRSAFYTNLGPGEYTFRVRAFGENGRVAGRERTLSYAVAAHPWEIPWLLALFALAIVGIAVVAVRHRVRALARRNEELQELIRERDRAERAAVRAEIQYRSLMETAEELVVRTDEAGAILSMNRAAREILGIAPGEIEDLRFQDLLAEEHERGAEAILGSMSREIQEVRLEAADGSEIPVEVSGQAIPPESGGPGFLILGRDLRRRRQLEAQLRQAQKMDAMGRLAGGVAHDFNNLLTVIAGAAALLEDDLDDGEEHPDLVEIREAADKGAALTRQLLAFGRPGEVGQTMRPLDLNDLVERMTTMLRRLVGSPIELRTSLAPGEPMVRADESQMSQVVLNLVVNARDAIADTGTVEISTGIERIARQEVDGRPSLEPGRYATLTVRDTGTGIPEEHLDRIFDPFFSTKTADRGTGLGLSTVFGIVRDHGGEIEVASEPGGGTTFTVRLPLLENPDETRRQDAGESSGDREPDGTDG